MADKRKDIQTETQTQKQAETHTKNKEYTYKAAERQNEIHKDKQKNI